MSPVIDTHPVLRSKYLNTYPDSMMNVELPKVKNAKAHSKRRIRWSSVQNFEFVRRMTEFPSGAPFTEGYGKVKAAWDSLVASLTAMEMFKNSQQLTGKKAQEHWKRLRDIHIEKKENEKYCTSRGVEYVAMMSGLCDLSEKSQSGEPQVRKPSSGNMNVAESTTRINESQSDSDMDSDESSEMSALSDEDINELNIFLKVENDSRKEITSAEPKKRSKGVKRVESSESTISCLSLGSLLGDYGSQKKRGRDDDFEYDPLFEEPSKRLKVEDVPSVDLACPPTQLQKSCENASFYAEKFAKLEALFQSQYLATQHNFAKFSKIIDAQQKTINKLVDKLTLKTRNEEEKLNG